MSATYYAGIANIRTNPAVRPAVYVGRSGRLDYSFDVAPRNTATRRSPSQSSTSCSPYICSARRLAACSSMQSSFAAQITCRLLSTTNILYRMMQSHPKGGPSPYSDVRLRSRQTSTHARGTFVRVAIRLYQRASLHRPREDASGKPGQDSALQWCNLTACRSEQLELKMESIPSIISSTPSQVAVRLGASLRASAVSTSSQSWSQTERLPLSGSPPHLPLEERIRRPLITRDIQADWTAGR